MRPADEPELQAFDCPRCNTPVEERFWGPCTRCRGELVAAQGVAAQRGAASAEVSAGTRFEPAMHVVPNHVATKD